MNPIRRDLLRDQVLESRKAFHRVPSRNFSQLPLIDMLLGTFYNPKVDPREDAALRVGFADNLDDLNTPKGVLKQLCMHDMRAAQANLTVPIPAAGTADCAEP